MEDNNNSNNSKLNRRQFLGLMGTGAAAVGAASLAGCTGGSSTVYDTAGHHTDEVPVGQMTYRTNAANGDKVSILGYGCMRWPTLASPDANGNIIDQEQVNSLIKYALDHGVNYFDTAPVYVQGQSEQATGIALKASGYPRESYYIATKLSNHRVISGTLATTPEGIYDQGVAMYRASMTNLQTDYIDYYLLHNIGNDFDSFNRRYVTSGLLEFLKKEREAGRIRNLGYSFHGKQEVFDYLMQLHDEGVYKWDFVQIQMNYLDWEHGSTRAAWGANVDAKYLYDELDKRHIPITIMEPLLGGRLSDVPQHVVARLKEREPANSIASWAFRFCGTYPNVLSVLSGMTYMEHLQDNIRSFAPLKPLTEDELAYLHEMAGIMSTYPTVACNKCNYCMPCPYGLDIPAILTHYNKCVNEGNFAESSQDENYRKARQAFLVGYDRSVPKLRQASHCTGCNQCSPECPQRINIPAELQKIDAYVEKLRQGTL